MAIYLLSDLANRLNARQLHRYLGLTDKSVRFFIEETRRRYETGGFEKETQCPPEGGCSPYVAIADIYATHTHPPVYRPGHPEGEFTPL